MNTCGVCGERATCAYSYGANVAYACPAHDPTRQPGWVTITLNCNFTYCTLPSFPVLAAQHTYTTACDGWHPPGPCPPAQVIHPGTAAGAWDAGSWG